MRPYLSQSRSFPRLLHILHCTRLELLELLDVFASPRQDTQYVEAHLQAIVLVTHLSSRLSSTATHCLAQRPTLAHGHLITDLDTESGRDVCGEVLVATLVTVVLGDEVEVLAADDEGTVHLGADDLASQDTAADGDETSEGTFLVCQAAIR